MSNHRVATLRSFYFRQHDRCWTLFSYLANDGCRWIICKNKKKNHYFNTCLFLCLRVSSVVPTCTSAHISVEVERRNVRSVTSRHSVCDETNMWLAPSNFFFFCKMNCFIVVGRDDKDFIHFFYIFSESYWTSRTSYVVGRRDLRRIRTCFRLFRFLFSYLGQLYLPLLFFFYCHGESVLSAPPPSPCVY